MKEKNLLAVPFDKGVGICVMKKHTNGEKLSEILKLQQFEKYEDNRANAHQSNFKEELRIGDKLREMKAQNKIDNALFGRMKS